MPADGTHDEVRRRARRRALVLSATLWVMAVVATILAVAIPLWAKFSRG